jgi:hypothetical protein
MQMLVQAKRTKVVPIFAQAPQQSDYTVMWQAGGSQQATQNAKETKTGWVKRAFPGVARLFHVAKMGIDFYRRQSLRNRKFFRPVKKE